MERIWGINSLFAGFSFVFWVYLAGSWNVHPSPLMCGAQFAGDDNDGDHDGDDVDGPQFWETQGVICSGVSEQGTCCSSPSPKVMQNLLQTSVYSIMDLRKGLSHFPTGLHEVCNAPGAVLLRGAGLFC